jgi:NAD(P)-dependent dehydrogenase (short-subunit alcohol dehydrogenase family)
MLQGKVALITGASSGIGRATAIAMAGSGARVALVGREQESLHRVAEVVAGRGHQAVLLIGDLRNDEDCRRFVADTVAILGRLDVLVNCAGTIATGTIENTTPGDWRSMFDLNLDAVFRMMQLSVPHLSATQGSVVNVSSVTGIRAFPGLLAYCVSKAAVDQLTRCSALELAPRRIRVNAVNPGVVVTNLHRHGGMDEAKYQAFLEHSKSTHPLGRVGTPEEVADLIAFLASEKAAWITGGSFPIDGGRHQTCAR